MSSCCSVSEGKTAAPAVMLCPECGNRSKQVERLTVKSLVRHLPFGMPAVQYYFCEAPGCAVVCKVMGGRKVPPLSMGYSSNVATGVISHPVM